MTTPLRDRFLAFIDKATTVQGYSKSGVPSTHPVRSRSQSLGVIGCHFVFRMGRSISQTQNPAYRRSRPTFCIPKTASFGRQIDVADSDLAAARCLADSIRTCRGNSKSMANLLCAYAVPDDARARTVSTQCSADGRVRHVAAAASAHQQHELPAHVTVLAGAVRLGNLGEREGLRDRE